MLPLKKLELHFDLSLFLFLLAFDATDIKKEAYIFTFNFGLVADHPEEKLRRRFSKNTDELAAGWSKVDEAGTGQA